MAQTRGEVTIDDGSIQVGGKEIGRVDGGLKFGYHPCVKMEIGQHVEWFEWDTPELIDKVFKAVDAQLAKV
jgi:hypothetical protein